MAASASSAEPAPAEQDGSLSRHRDLRLLWTDDLVSRFGSEISLFAQPVVMIRASYVSWFLKFSNEIR